MAEIHINPATECVEHTVPYIGEDANLITPIDAIRAAAAHMMAISDKPIAIVMTENHASVTQTAMPFALARHIKEQDPRLTLGFGYEYRHNLATPHSAQDDPDGLQGIGAYIKLPNDSIFTPFTRKKGMELLHDLKVSVSFNDIAFTYTDNPDDPAYAVVDLKDDFTRSLLPENRHNDRIVRAYRDTRNHATDPEGLILSNKGMAKKAMAHVNRLGAQVYVMQVGSYHSDCGQWNKPVYERLSKDACVEAFLKAEGFNVLRVFYATSQQDAISRFQGEHYVRIHSLSPMSVKRRGLSPQEQKFYQTINKYSQNILSMPQ